MSRVAKAPVTIPAGVEVTLNGQEIAVKGKNGTLKRTLNAAVIVTKEENVLKLTWLLVLLLASSANWCWLV